jgi:hypothetical protein
MGQPSWTVFNASWVWDLGAPPSYPVVSLWPCPIFLLSSLELCGLCVMSRDPSLHSLFSGDDRPVTSFSSSGDCVSEWTCRLLLNCLDFVFQIWSRLTQRGPQGRALLQSLNGMFFKVFKVEWSGRRKITLLLWGKTCTGYDRFLFNFMVFGHYAHVKFWLYAWWTQILIAESFNVFISWPRSILLKVVQLSLHNRYILFWSILAVGPSALPNM